MAEFTPSDQPAGIDVVSRYDATEAWGAGMDRKIRKQEEVEKLIRYWLNEDHANTCYSDEEIAQEASNLLERLKKIDRT